MNEQPIQSIGNENSASDGTRWLSMSEAALETPYSAEYLSLLARKKKLSSKKVGNTWYTTKAILNDYMKKQMVRTQVQNGNFQALGETSNSRPPMSVAPNDESYSLEQVRSYHGDIKKYFPRLERVESTEHVERALEKVIDKKFAGAISTSLRLRHLKVVLSSKILLAAALVVFVLLSILPVPVVFSFFDKSLEYVKDAFNDANTVMGFRPGTHANEILLLDENGNISILGHVETEGQLRSYVESGIAPIVVDSITKVENLNADYIDGLGALDFTLAFVTKNGNMTTEDVLLEGNVEVGQTLLVRGAASLISTLEVGDKLKVFGDAEFKQALKVLGPAYFESLVTLADDVSVGKNASIGGGILVEGNADIRQNVAVRGSVEAGSAVLGKSGSFGSLGASGSFSAGGKITLGNPADVLTIDSKNVTLDNNGNLALDGSLGAATISTDTLSVTNSIITNATTTNIFSTTASSTNLFFTRATGTSATTTNFFSTIFTGGSLSVGETATSSINGLGDLFVVGSTTLQNFTFVNATGTSATTTNLFSTTASSTNLFSTSGNIGALTGGTGIMGTLLVNGSTTLQNFTFVNATGTSATTTNFFSTTGTFDEVYVNNYQQNDGTFLINSTVATGDIFAVTDNSITSGTLIHQTFTANAGNGQISSGQIIDLTDSTVAGGGYTAFAINASGAGVGSGDKYLVDLNPGVNTRVVFDPTGSLRPTVAAGSNTTSLGSPSFYWNNAYIDTLTANNLSGTVITGETSSDTWTIGSDETGDTNKALIFQRNSGSGNALLQWNAGAGDLRYLSANYPFNATYTVTDASIGTDINLLSGNLTNNTTSGTQKLLSLTNTGTGTTENGIYINNTGTGSTAIEIDGTWTTAFITDPDAGNVGIGTTTPWGLLSVNPNGISGPAFVVGSSTATNLIVTNGGNVGIGTTSPGTLLHLSKTTAADTDLRFESQGYNWIMGIDNSDAGKFKIASSTALGTNDRLVIDGSGNVGIGTADIESWRSDFTAIQFDYDAIGAYNSSGLLRFYGNAYEDGVSAYKYRSTGAASLYQIDSGTHDFKVAASGTADNPITWTNGLHIGNSGNVGIGTTGPGQLLHIEEASPRMIISATAVDAADSGRLDIGGDGVSSGLLGSSIYMRFDNSADIGIIGTRGSSADTDTIYLTKSTGNVGIGTTAPSFKLDVSGSTTLLLGADGSASTRTDATSKVATVNYVHYTNAEEPITLISGTSAATTNSIFIGGGGVTTNAVTSVSIWTAENNTTLTGTRRLHIDSTGRVGIGTAAPTYNLDVTGNARFTSLVDASHFVATSSSATSTFAGGLAVETSGLVYDFSSNNVGIGTTGPATKLDVWGTAGANDIFNVASSSGTSVLRVTKSGNVGIGTASPGQKFTVDSGTASTIAAFSASNAVPRLLITGSGGSALLGVRDADAFVQHSAAAGVRIEATGGGLGNLYAGNVGIGTTGPGAKLHVYQDLNDAAVATPSVAASYQMYISGAAGTSGDTVGIAFGTVDGSATEVTGSIYAVDAGASGIGHLAFATNAAGTVAEKMRILSSGNVGIGTTGPRQILELSSTAGEFLMNESDQGANGKLWGMNFSGGLMSFRLLNDAYSAATDWMVVERSGTTVTDVSFPNGKVGIGTTGPTNKLEIDAGRLALNTGVTGSWVNAAQAMRFGVDSGIGVIQTPFNSDIQVVDDDGVALATFKQSGNVGIGTTTPWRTFSAVGTVGFSSTLTSSNNANYLCINTSSYEVTRNTVCDASSERWKENITDIDYGLEEVLALRPVTFTFKESMNVGTSTKVGFIAEEVALIAPEIVSYDDEGLPDGLDYSKLTPLLVKAVQEISLRINGLFEVFLAQLSDMGVTITSAFTRVMNLFADTIHIENQLCVDDICISRENLKSLLTQYGGVSVNALSSGGSVSADPAPAPAPAPAPEPAPDPAPDPAPEPVAEPEPVPAETAQEPALEEPDSASGEPASAPDEPAPVAEEPTAEPAPAPEPAPEETPVLEPEPESEQAPAQESSEE